MCVNMMFVMLVGVGGCGGEYWLCGYKWFFFVLMCDVYFVVVCIEVGSLLCFYVLCWCLDGMKNVVEI